MAAYIDIIYRELIKIDNNYMIVCQKGGPTDDAERDPDEKVCLSRKPPL